MIYFFLERNKNDESVNTAARVARSRGVQRRDVRPEGPRHSAVAEVEGCVVREVVHRGLGGAGGCARECSRVLITLTRFGRTSEGSSYSRDAPGRAIRGARRAIASAHADD